MNAQYDVADAKQPHASDRSQPSHGGRPPPARVDGPGHGVVPRSRANIRPSDINDMLLDDDRAEYLGKRDSLQVNSTGEFNIDFIKSMKRRQQEDGIDSRKILEDMRTVQNRQSSQYDGGQHYNHRATINHRDRSQYSVPGNQYQRTAPPRITDRKTIDLEENDGSLFSQRRKYLSWKARNCYSQ